ncbi:hypothetical protein N1F89_07245 [Aquibium sp. A9E412]|uniref:hypothetical protein n=1 Tax=Aquibium sp. A9E412 TaxID=2976767 RepID=UPI0025B09A35|nr:hypothetical protein [Aquibium sp. A9E412]MDN2566011.1 hypothetical protein [Aquibium sp. A9E412]
MIRPIAIAAALASALATTPALTQGFERPGASSGFSDNCAGDPRCGRGTSGRAEGPPGGVQRVPPGYYRPDPRDPAPPPGYRRPDPRHPRPPSGYYRWDPPRYEYRDRITCNEGRRILRYNGFVRIRALDCDGTRYAFRAVRDGRSYIVTLNAWTGEILRIRRA